MPTSSELCNLDQTGVSLRKKYAIGAGIFGVLGLATLYVIGASALVRYVFAVGSIHLTLINWRQARNSFCVLNGFTGTTEASLKRTKLLNPMIAKLARRQAIKEFALVLSIALVVGLIALLPN